MNTNQNALDCLAQEGIPMTEPELLRAMLKTQLNRNGAAMVPEAPSYDLAAFERVPWNDLDLNPARDVATITTTRKTPETDKVVEGLVAVPAVEDQLLSRRGRQKTPKTWLISVLCFTGIHKGQWKFPTEGNCAQGRECQRCGSVHVRIKHQQEWRYMRDFACQQLQSCKRCNLANSDRTLHEWSESWVIGTGWWQSSKEAHRCLRCGAMEEWTVDND